MIDHDPPLGALGETFVGQSASLDVKYDLVG
jgi:hypothetical protein